MDFPTSYPAQTGSIAGLHVYDNFITEGKGLFTLTYFLEEERDLI